MNKSLVSIAMTTYNGEKYLTEQIDSILNQSYKNIELVTIVLKMEHGAYYKNIRTIGNYDLVCTNSLLVDENNSSLGYTLKDTLTCYSISENQDLLFKHLCFHNFAQGSTMLARAQFLKTIKIPVETNYRIFHDHWYAINATVLGNGLMYIDKPSIRYRQHQAQVTVKKEKNTLNV